jgi:hypothetical protein
MKKLIERLARFWSTDRSLTALLALLVVMLFVMPPLGGVAPLEGLGGRILYTLLLISGVLAATRNRRATVVAGLVVSADIVVNWAAAMLSGRGIHAASLALSMATVVILIFVVMAHVFREGPITMHRVFGAVAAYLLLGLAWTFAYSLTDLLLPGSFSLQVPAGESRFVAFIYYSFVTLSTVGYGDIAPVHRVARSLATAEALTGQLFPAILIARLVAMELYYRQARKERRAHGAEKPGE